MNRSWFSGLKTGVSQFTKLSKELLAESLHQDEANEESVDQKDHAVRSAADGGLFGDFFDEEPSARYREHHDDDGSEGDDAGDAARDSELTAQRSKARTQRHADRDSGPESEREAERKADEDAEAEVAESASTSHTAPISARDVSASASAPRERRASHPIEVEDVRPHQDSSASGASASATAGDWANEDDEAGFAVEWSVPERKSEFELELEAGGGGHQVHRATAGPGRISRPSGTEPVELFAASTPTSASRHPSSTSTSSVLSPPARRPSGEQHTHAHAEGSLLEATDAADLDESSDLLVAAAAFEPPAHPDACTSSSSSQQQIAASPPPPPDNADLLDSSQAATPAPPPVALSPELTSTSTSASESFGIAPDGGARRRRQSLSLSTVERAAQTDDALALPLTRSELEPEAAEPVAEASPPARPETRDAEAGTEPEPEPEPEAPPREREPAVCCDEGSQTPEPPAPPACVEACLQTDETPTAADAAELPPCPSPSPFAAQPQTQTQTESAPAVDEQVQTELPEHEPEAERDESLATHVRATATVESGEQTDALPVTCEASVGPDLVDSLASAKESAGDVERREMVSVEQQTEAEADAKAEAALVEASTLTDAVAQPELLHPTPAVEAEQDEASTQTESEPEVPAPVAPARPPAEDAACETESAPAPAVETRSVETTMADDEHAVVPALECATNTERVHSAECGTNTEAEAVAARALAVECGTNTEAEEVAARALAVECGTSTEAVGVVEAGATSDAKVETEPVLVRDVCTFRQASTNTGPLPNRVERATDTALDRVLTWCDSGSQVDADTLLRWRLSRCAERASQTDAKQTRGVNLQVNMRTPTAHQEAQTEQLEVEPPAPVLPFTLQDWDALQEQISSAKEREIRLQAENDRLKIHLMELDQQQTASLVEAQNREQAALRRLDISNEEMSTLRSKLGAAERNAETARADAKLYLERLQEYYSAHERLQSVLQVYEREKQERVIAETETLNERLASTQEELDTARRRTNDLEAQVTKLSSRSHDFERLTQELASKEVTIDKLQTNLRHSENLLFQSGEEMRKMRLELEARIDKTLITNMLVSYWMTPPRQRLEALALLGSVLQIMPGDLERATAAEGAALGLRAGGAAGSRSGAGAQDSTAFAQFGSQFVAFLEKESAKNNAQGSSIGAARMASTSGSQQGFGLPAGAEGFERAGQQQQFSLAQIDQMVNEQRERLVLQRRPQAPGADASMSHSPKQHRDSLTGTYRVTPEYSTSSALHNLLKDANGSASQLSEVPLDESLVMESTADALQQAVSGARAFEITARPVPSTAGFSRQFTSARSSQSIKFNSNSYIAATSRPMITASADRSAATGPIFIQDTELGHTIPQFPQLLSTTARGGLTPNSADNTLMQKSGSSALGGDVIDL